MMSKNFLKNCWKAIRRRLIYIFNPWYIFRQQKIYQGNCLNCSGCCKLNFLYYNGNCRYLVDGKCSVYKTKKMPTLCWIYPIDEKDIWEEYKDTCKFNWNNKL